MLLFPLSNDLIPITFFGGKPDPKQTKKTLRLLMSHFSYLGSQSKRTKLVNSKDDEEIVGEYQALMEQEMFDFVLFEIPWITTEDWIKSETTATTTTTRTDCIFTWFYINISSPLLDNHLAVIHNYCIVILCFRVRVRANARRRLNCQWMNI